MTRRPSPKVAAFVILGGLGVLAGTGLRRPEAAAIGLAFLLGLLLALVLAEEPKIEVDMTLERDRVLQGETVVIQLTFFAPRGCHWLRYLLVLPPGLTPRERGPVRGLRLAPGREQTVRFDVDATRWGGMRVGPIVLEARDALGAVAWDAVVDRRLALRVHPREEALARAIRPRETQVFAGDEVARSRGEGIEFAEVRPYAPGDSARSINWRRTTRSRELYVNDTHPERNADVVLFLDSFTDVTHEGGGTLDTAVRGAVSLARHYAGRRDRVGVIGFGGSLRWLLPAMGAQQMARIADALIDTEVMFSYAWKGVDVIPPRTLPPRAMIVALTPLLDERAITALLDLRGRGFDLSIVEVSPELAAGGRGGVKARSGSEADEVGHRLWRLQRELLRDRYRRLGVPIAAWTPGTPLAPVIEEIERFKRFARVGRS